MFIGSVALLLLNDHVLKSAWPGWVTGKLSDVAGVAMVAVALAAILRRSAPALVVTAVAFTALKTVPVVAVWAAPVLGGVTRTDPTDLVALVVLLALRPFLVRRLGAAPPAAPASPADPLRRRRSPRVLVVQTLAIGCAVVATTATSADCAGQGVTDVGTVGGDVYARTPDGWYRSQDGGVLWDEFDLPDDGTWPAGLTFAGFSTVCEGPERCLETSTVAFEGADAVLVEEVRGGERTPIFAIEPADRIALDALVDETSVACGDLYGTSAVAVERPDGEHAVVAMGTLGVLHRTPAGGWEWVPVGDTGLGPDQLDDEPFDIGVRGTRPGPGLTRFAGPAGVALLLASPILLLVAVAPLRRFAERRGRRALVGTAACIGVAITLLVVGVALALIGPGDGWSPLIVGGAWFAIAAATAGAAFAYHARPRSGRRRAPPDDRAPVG